MSTPFTPAFSRRPLAFLHRAGWTLLTLALSLSVSSRAATAIPAGATPCLTGTMPSSYGTFLLLKQEVFRQSDNAAPTTDGAIVRIDLSAPSAYSISNATLSGPGGFKVALPRQADGSSTTTESGTATSILPKYPSGAWNTSFQLAFTNGDSFIGFFPFLLASNVPPIPAIANLGPAQSIDARTAFALSWNLWTGTTTHDRVNLTIADASGTVVFSAASDCSGQTNLAPGATSLEIPAGRLAANTTYTGSLTFGANLLSNQDDSTLIFERAFESRTTLFTLKTAPASTGGSPGTFQNPSVSGTNLVFVLKGTAGDVQRIESTTGFVSWTTEREVTIPAGGSIEVTLPLPADGTPRFYRAVAVGGATPAADPATLSIALNSPGELDITVRGTPGATYNVERTIDGITWTNVATATIPADGTPQVVYVTVPAGASYLLARAVVRPPAPPVVLLEPTLGINLVTTGGGFSTLRISLTGGTPRKNYLIQQKAATDPAATWTSTGQSISTDINGNGTVATFFIGRFPGPGGVVANPGNTGFLYRAFIR